MPEGDSIRRLAAAIDRRLTGAVVVRSTFRHPRLATSDLAGARVVGTGSHGKHLFVRFDDGRSLHIHLLMQGRVRFDGAPGVDVDRRRFDIVFDRGRLTGVDIPKLHLVSTAREGLFTDALGPDVCGDFDAEVALDRLGRAVDLPLGGALLDQRLIAGFGNIYAVEVPFVCGVSPLTAVGAIDRLEVVVDVGAALIRTNADRGPQNTTGRRLDRSDHWILPARVRRCPLCGERLRRLDEAASPWGRRTAVCDTCQPPGSGVVDVDRARRLLALHPARHRLTTLV